jgi:hypothetical protein
MQLEDVADGEQSFVDANILTSHFSGISSACRTFLQRCESKQVEAFRGQGHAERFPRQLGYAASKPR